MTGVVHKTAGPDTDGMRVDRWFKEAYPNLPFGRLSKLLRTGQIRINGKRAKIGDRLKAGDDIRIPPLGDMQKKQVSEKAAPLSKEDMAFVQNMVILERDDLFVLNKPPGLAVQGGSGMTRHVDGLLPALQKGKKGAPRLVHRLDKDTSGVLLVARGRQAAQDLTRAFRQRETQKTYWALVKGVPEAPAGVIDLPLKKREGKGGERVNVAEDGKRSVTWYSVVESAGSVTAWVALRPVTGRTHQLRAHMEALGTPIVGDGKYGGKDAFLEGQVSKKLHLHAESIVLSLPGGKNLNVHAPLPDHMRATWDFFGFADKPDHDPFEDFEE